MITHIVWLLILEKRNKDDEYLDENEDKNEGLFVPHKWHKPDNMKHKPKEPIAAQGGLVLNQLEEMFRKTSINRCAWHIVPCSIIESWREDHIWQAVPHIGFQYHQCHFSNATKNGFLYHQCHATFVMPRKMSSSYPHAFTYSYEGSYFTLDQGNSNNIPPACVLSTGAVCPKEKRIPPKKKKIPDQRHQSISGRSVLHIDPNHPPII